MKELSKCPICHTLHETGNFLFEEEDEDIVTQWSQCPSCHSKINEGQIALIEAIAGEESEFEDIHVPSTGKFHFISEDFFTDILHIDVPVEAMGMVFVERDIYSTIKAKYKMNLH